MWERFTNPCLEVPFANHFHVCNDQGVHFFIPSINFLWSIPYKLGLSPLKLGNSSPQCSLKKNQVSPVTLFKKSEEKSMSSGGMAIGWSMRGEK